MQAMLGGDSAEGGTTTESSMKPPKEIEVSSEVNNFIEKQFCCQTYCLTLKR